MREEKLKKLAELRFVAQAAQLQGVRTLIREAVDKKGYSTEFIERIVLAANEACANIIRHAYGDTGEGEIVLEILQGDGELVFRLTDFAPPVDPATIRSRELDDIRPGGLGVHLINEIMDDVVFRNNPSGTGNMLEMTAKTQVENRGNSNSQ